MDDIDLLHDNEETGEEVEILVVGEADSGRRLDVFIAGRLHDCTRSFVQKLIEEGSVSVFGSPIIKSNFRLSVGEIVTVRIPPPVQLDLAAENIPLDVVFEDAQLLVVNKPQGMVVHPAAGNYKGTLVNALLYHCRDLSGINGILRPGIVHRIDKDTSGLLVVAKTDKAHLGLAEQLKAHTMSREYLALVSGVMPEPGGTVDAPIGRDPKDRKRMAVVHGHSKPAVTHYGVKERYKENTYVECRLETGRTHQIRVHLAYINHPVLGDPLYNSRRKDPFDLKGQALHAAVLGFVHPTGGQKMEFSVPLPQYFKEVLELLRQAKPN